MNRKKRASVAKETLEILQSGKYVTAQQNSIDIGREITAAIEGTILYSPSDLDDLRGRPEFETEATTHFEVTNCTTFAAASDLVARGYDNPLCLNFASAKNPGGGFLGGSQAQEEALARASALYACINPVREYYERNRACRSAIYTDHMIYSPRVPVFRDDDDHLIAPPYFASIITAPAVNAGAVTAKAPKEASRIESVMRGRIESVLAVAAKHGHRTLVLGAWGCGVFRNNPVDIAQWFRDALIGMPRFRNVFDRVVFGVLDRTGNGKTFDAFESAFTK